MKPVNLEPLGHLRCESGVQLVEGIGFLDLDVDALGGAQGHDVGHELRLAIDCDSSPPDPASVRFPVELDLDADGAFGPPGDADGGLHVGVAES